ncbi:MAG: lytic transglycosylase domain-containing protein [Bacteriovoracaceae bacterium]|nr:lytic transglycosylase domain-containing protein [Bacteriovoracaceae bacterium]
MFHLLAISLVIFLGSINGYSSPIPKEMVLEIKQLSKPQRKDIQSAKNLEDFYWSFRKQKMSGMKNALKNIQHLKSPHFKRYIVLLKDGVKLQHELQLNKTTSCESKSSDNHVEQKFRALYRKICLKIISQNILRKKTNLSSHEREFIEKNWQYLSSFKTRSQFISLLESLKPTDRIFFSQILRNFIFNKRKLPHKDLLRFVVIDQKLTKHIQDLHLFDEKHKGFYSREFTFLVQQFKKNYLVGNDDLSQDYLEKAIDFYDLNHQRIDNSKAWTLFITSGKKVARREDLTLALDLFKISEKTADSDQLHESKFQMLFTLYRDRKLSDAREFIQNEDLIKNFDQLNSKLRFWISRVFQESKEFKKAKELYLKQIELSPLSFYSILSLKNLRRFTPEYDISLLVTDNTPLLNNLNLSKDVLNEIFLFDTFKTAGSNFLSSIQAQEIRYISSSRFFNDVEPGQSIKLKSYFLIKFFSDRNEHLSSFKVAYTKLNQGVIKLNSLVIDSLFPNKFRGIVKSKSSVIDEKILLSLIRQESAFNERAQSIVGARGLMQIMPATGKQYVRNLKASNLYDPNLNVTIGAKYLEKLLRRYDGSLVFALAAYNAGMGNVGRWQKTIPFSDDNLANIEMIPFKETRNYVKLIYRNLFFYSYIDGVTDHIDLPMNQSFKVALD